MMSEEELTEKEVEEVLEEMVEDGYVEKVIINGEVKYRATKKGLEWSLEWAKNRKKKKREANPFVD